MDKFEAGQESSKTLFGKIMVVFVFVAVMTSLIVYFNRSEPDIKRTTLESLAQQFGASVTNAHWQWQAEGKPSIVMLVHYEPRLDDSNELVEKDRRPIQMSHMGFPRVSPTSMGCGKAWEMVLNMPLEIEGFRVVPEYYDGGKQADQTLEARCRFRLSVGPYFDYWIYTGAVSKVQG